MGVVGHGRGVRLLVQELVSALGGLEVGLERRRLGVRGGGRRGHGRRSYSFRDCDNGRNTIILSLSPVSFALC